MPKLSATDGPSTDFIKRTDVSPEDIRNMSMEQLGQFLADLRRNRETLPARKASGQKRKSTNESNISGELLDDDSGGIIE